jgi:hypothetical protein
MTSKEEYEARIAQCDWSDLEWQMARRHPKEWLTAVMPDRAAVAHHLNGVGEDTLSVLRQHALVRQLMQFLSSVSVDAGR